MDISPEVALIIEFLQTSTSEGLQDEALFAQFLQHGQSADRQEEVGRLAFHGKHLHNLYLALRRQTQGSELFEKLEAEFSRSVNDFHGMITAFVSDAEQEFRGTVERQTLEVSEQGLRSLLALAQDFAALKNLELEVSQSEAGHLHDEHSGHLHDDADHARHADDAGNADDADDDSGGADGGPDNPSDGHPG